MDGDLSSWLFKEGLEGFAAAFDKKGLRTFGDLERFFDKRMNEYNKLIIRVGNRAEGERLTHLLSSYAAGRPCGSSPSSPQSDVERFFTMSASAKGCEGINVAEVFRTSSNGEKRQGTRSPAEEGGDTIMRFFSPSSAVSSPTPASPPRARHITVDRRRYDERLFVKNEALRAALEGVEVELCRDPCCVAQQLQCITKSEDALAGAYDVRSALKCRNLHFIYFKLIFERRVCFWSAKHLLDSDTLESAIELYLQGEDTRLFACNRTCHRDIGGRRRCHFAHFCLVVDGASRDLGEFSFSAALNAILRQQCVSYVSLHEPEYSNRIISIEEWRGPRCGPMMDPVKGVCYALRCPDWGCFRCCGDGAECAHLHDLVLRTPLSSGLRDHLRAHPAKTSSGPEDPGMVAPRLPFELATNTISQSDACDEALFSSCNLCCYHALQAIEESNRGRFSASVLGVLMARLCRTQGSLPKDVSELLSNACRTMKRQYDPSMALSHAAHLINRAIRERLQAKPPQLKGQGVPAVVRVCWDIENVLLSYIDVSTFVYCVKDLLLQENIAEDVSCIAITAFGPRHIFLPPMIAELREMDVKMQLVMNKREEADRVIFNYISNELKCDEKLVLISSDKDFKSVLLECQKRAKAVYVIHGAPENGVLNDWYRSHLRGSYSLLRLYKNPFLTRTEKTLNVADLERELVRDSNDRGVMSFFSESSWTGRSDPTTPMTQESASEANPAQEASQRRKEQESHYLDALSNLMRPDLSFKGPFFAPFLSETITYDACFTVLTNILQLRLKEWLTAGVLRGPFAVERLDRNITDAQMLSEGRESGIRGELAFFWNALREKGYLPRSWALFSGDIDMIYNKAREHHNLSQLASAQIHSQDFSQFAAASGLSLQGARIEYDVLRNAKLEQERHLTQCTALLKTPHALWGSRGYLSRLYPLSEPLLDNESFVNNHELHTIFPNPAAFPVRELTKIRAAGNAEHFLRQMADAAGRPTLRDSYRGGLSSDASFHWNSLPGDLSSRFPMPTSAWHDIIIDASDCRHYYSSYGILPRIVGEYITSDDLDAEPTESLNPPVVYPVALQCAETQPYHESDYNLEGLYRLFRQKMALRRHNRWVEALSHRVQAVSTRDMALYLERNTSVDSKNDQRFIQFSI